MTEAESYWQAVEAAQASTEKRLRFAVPYRVANPGTSRCGTSPAPPTGRSWSAGAGECGDFVEGVATAITPMALYEIIMAKGYQTLVDPDTRVDVNTGMLAASRLQTLLDARSG